MKTQTKLRTHFKMYKIKKANSNICSVYIKNCKLATREKFFHGP